jgi:hypothetical protein
MGVNLGKREPYACIIDLSNYPNQHLIAGGHTFSWPADLDLFFPIKLEFHYPIHKDLFFNAETGVWIKGIITRFVYGKDFNIVIQRDYMMDDYYDPVTNIYYLKPYYSDYGWMNFSKVTCKLLLGLGLSYKLPYGDLVRFTTGVNISFNNIIEGYYKYYSTEFDPTESYGTFAVKNDFIYTQLSYIHTFNFLKAKKHVKKQEYSFSSKQERSGKILELLK